MSGAERRAQPRFQIELGAEVATPERTFTAATKDVSTGGACLEGPYTFHEGAELKLSLYLVVDGIEESSMPPLEVRATVQWTATNDESESTWKHMAGLKFVNASDAQIQWLENVIARSG